MVVKDIQSLKQKLLWVLIIPFKVSLTKPGCIYEDDADEDDYDDDDHDQWP